MDQIHHCLPALPVHCDCYCIDISISITLKMHTMKKNMGSTDKTIRIILAVVFAGLFFSGTVTGLFGYILLALGGIFVLTSLFNFCPIYALVGVSTCPAPERK